MKKIALLIIISICLVALVTVPALDAFAFGKKYVKFKKFVPKNQKQENVLAIIKDFKETTNKEDKEGHFALFADDGVIVVKAGQHYSETMSGKKEITAKTPWTGTKIEFTKIWFGKIKNGTAEVNTKVKLIGGESGKRSATYEWILTQIGEAWKIKELKMNIR